MQNPRDKPTISMITTSWYALSSEIENSAKFFEDSGFNVRVRTSGMESKEQVKERDLPTVFQKIKKNYFEARTPLTDEEKKATQKVFEQDFQDYSAAYVRMKKNDSASIDTGSRRSKELDRLGQNEFSELDEYLQDAHQKSLILKEELEAASRGEVDVIWPVDGGSGAPEMLKFLPEKLPENPAVIVGMSDVTAVQNALIQSTNYTMKGIQEHGSRVHGYEHYAETQKERINKLFSTIKKVRDGETLDAEYSLTAGEKNKKPTKPQLVNLSGGTLNVIDRASDSPYPLGQDQNSDSVVVEMHGQAKTKADEISQEKGGGEADAFEKIFGNKKNIMVGNVLFDKGSKEYQHFTDRAAKEGINVYEGMKFGHGGDKWPWEPIPLNVPSVLLPGKSSAEATLLIDPSKERLQEKLEEIGYEITPSQFLDTLNKDPLKTREFITSDPEIAAVMIKYSGLEASEIFERAGVTDESIQKQITAKLDQGYKEPSEKRLPLQSAASALDSDSYRKSSETPGSRKKQENSIGPLEADDSKLGSLKPPASPSNAEKKQLNV